MWNSRDAQNKSGQFTEIQGDQCGGEQVERGWEGGGKYNKEGLVCHMEEFQFYIAGQWFSNYRIPSEPAGE